MKKMTVTFALIAFASLAAVHQQAAVADRESEPIQWSDGTYDISVMSAVVTSDANGTHITAPGVAAFGVNHDGVGDLLINNDADPAFEGRCTASLLTLGGRQWAILAAHCLTTAAGVKNANNLQLTFETPVGNKVSTVSAPGQMHINPNWNGSAFNGFDVALIQLDAVAHVAVPNYLLNRTVAELNKNVVHVGYGNRGHGPTGQVGGTSGTKRAGLKEWEEQGLGNRGVGGITNNSTMLTDDFDSGAVANDAFNFFFGDAVDVGFGADEVGVSQGDSGGPGFLQDGATWKIAGVHSHGLRLAAAGGGASSDVDAVLNFSWGEFGVDARVRDANILSWIDRTIPEPASLALLLMGLPLAIRRRKK